jgi:hypothetical protein
MLQAPQRRKQPWFRHGEVYCEGCGAQRGSDAHRQNEAPMSGNFIVGRRVNFLFFDRLLVPRISHRFRHEEVQDQRYVPNTGVICAC